MKIQNYIEYQKNRTLLDCTILRLEINFRLLTAEQVYSMLFELTSWTDMWMGNSFASMWKYKDIPFFVNKSGLVCDKIRKKISRSNKPPCVISLLFESLSCNDEVFDAKSYRRKRKELFLTTGVFRDESTDDYVNLYNSTVLPNLSDPDKLKRAVMDIFSIPEKKYMDLRCNSFDVQGLFYASQYKDIPNMYYGSQTVDINMQVIKDGADELSENLLQLVKDIAEKYVEVNATVSAVPFPFTASSPYLMYFGQDIREDGSHLQIGCKPAEWYKHYYLTGCEWANVISARTRALLPSVKPNTDDSVIAEELKNKALCVRSKKGILQTDISDLLEIKRFIYNALCPGNKTYTFEVLSNTQNFIPYWKPRAFWERVPIFEDEVSVSENGLIFKHL